MSYRVSRLGKVFLCLALVIAQCTGLYSSVRAIGGSTVHGYVSSNVSPGIGQSNYSAAGAAMSIKDSLGNLLGQTTVGSDGSFQFIDIPNGYSYLLEIEPPVDNPGSLLPYSMNLDVFGDTDLSQTYHNHLLTMYSQNTVPSEVLFDGINLVDGTPSADPDQQWRNLYIGNSDNGISRAMNIDAMVEGQYIYSNRFSVSIPPADGYFLYQQLNTGFQTFSRGIRDMTPKMNLTRDSYYVFNINTKERASLHTIRVLDQCGTPVPNVGIDGYRHATLTLRSDNTAKTVYAFFNYTTNSNGEISLPTQTQGYLENNDAGLALRLSYLDSASNTIYGLKETVISDPIPDTLVINVTLPQCLPDVTPPIINYGVDHTANSAGWYSTPARVFWMVADPNSAITTQTGCDAATVNNAITTLTCTATSSGGTTSKSVTVRSDSTPPTVSNVSMSFNGTALPLLGIVSGSSSNITANVADNLSGVVKAEFFIDSDPGIGNATDMAISSGKAMASVNISGLGTGSHTLHIRSKDLADNWSTVANYTFIKL